MASADDRTVNAHVDEGTIHAWLDGQLPVDESARVESHLASCAACRDLAAEARGLVAASSRILTALDDVPARVLPVPRRQVPAWQVRAAAAVVILALGTAAVLRNVGQRESLSRDGGGALSDSQAGSPTAATAAPPAPAPTPSAPAPSPPVTERSSSRSPRAAAASAPRASNKPSLKKEAPPPSSAAVSPQASESVLMGTPVAAPGAPPPARGAFAGVAAPEAKAQRLDQRAPTPSMRDVNAVAVAPATCVGREVSVSSGLAGGRLAAAGTAVRLGSMPSADPRYPGFALAAASDSGVAPAGSWTPLGSDSAIVSVRADADKAAPSLEFRRQAADSVARDESDARGLVRIRIDCTRR